MAIIGFHRRRTNLNEKYNGYSVNMKTNKYPLIGLRISMNKIPLLLIFLLIISFSGCVSYIEENNEDSLNKPPIAIILSDSNITYQFINVKLNASASWDPEEDVLFYKWDFGYRFFKNISTRRCK